MLGINENHKYFSELFECREICSSDLSSFTGREAALVLTLGKVFCYNAKNENIISL